MSDLKDTRPRVAFTGHRPDKLGGYGATAKHAEIAAALEVKLRELDPRVAISGMALGFDTIAARTCVKLGIPFVAALICDGHESRWPARARHEFRALCAHAARVVVVSPGPYEDWKPDARNEAMLRSSDVVVACYDGSKGGTRNAFTSAAKRGLPIHRLYPDTLEWRLYPGKVAR